MIDLKFLRENPDLVKENIKKKFQDHKLPLVDEVIEYEKHSRRLMIFVQRRIRFLSRLVLLWHRARRKRLRL
mgnify:CR=1 FL=1